MRTVNGDRAYEGNDLEKVIILSMHVLVGKPESEVRQASKAAQHTSRLDIFSPCKNFNGIEQILPRR
jgi:hypothetical protein